MYTLDPAGKRVYTLNKIVGGEVTKSAHPARFSPDDKYSRYASPSSSYMSARLNTNESGYRHRVTLKKRYGLLITQQSTMTRTRMLVNDANCGLEDKKVLGQ